jgi:cytoskeleton protein RodZ
MSQSKPEAQELFAEIGRKLKTAREAKGISLGELSANIRINQNYLQRIEAGQMEGLPALTFLRGFVRNFAIAVELDEGEILSDFKALVDLYNPGPLPLEPPAEVQPQPLVTFSPTKAILMGLLVAMIGWAAYLIVQVATAPDVEVSSTSQEQAPAKTAEPAPPGAAQPAAIEPPPQAAQPDAAPKSPAPVAVAPVEPPRNLQLTLHGLERSWVRLSVDRREPIDVFLEPAETGEWEANEEFRLTIGKSHGVSVYLNGEEILLPKEHNLLIPELVLNKLTLLKLEN